MKKHLKRRVVFYIVLAAFFAFNSVDKVIKYPEREDKEMQLFGIIILGIMAVFYVVDVIMFYRKKRTSRF